ncbi:ABC transporter substrate-binding protein [Halopelagius longus]|uniref:ABC-type glycerol-3-phosphate transport system, substrate-binding protein n=1 Tax=Halopelagius longus TaxID=1236180 RepID=A0A1H0XN88_9EURY|nr:extracellular solute-binding protein [Halopelagius longus]RDI71950.1 extracellular solute-binding protein [Halopelagius longus]SDQ04375.1 ABC-type glycerol-3-phosphate transport system, substrate-binding protein [Halopelagius longus]
MSNEQQSYDRLDRRSFVAGLGAAAAAGLAGCSGGGDGGSGTGGGGGSGSQSLDFWLFGGIPAEREYISNHYGEFSDHDVSYQHQEWGQKYQIIASAAANDNLPDVMAGQTQQIPDYAGAGAIQPLDREGFGDRLEEINGNFIEANVETQMYSGLGDTDGERQWGVPGGYADLGPFVDIRTDYLEQTSFDEPPRTWPELVQLGTEMQELDDVSAAITAPGTDFGLTAGYFIGFVYANGGRYYDPESLTATVDQPGFVDAVKLYQEIAEAGLFPDSIAENDHIAAGRLLREGESGIFITYSHANAVYQTTGAPQEWLDGEGHTVTRAPLPENPSGQFEPRDLLLQNAQGFMLANGTESDAELQAALDYIEWWSQPEQLAPWTYRSDSDVGIRGRVPTLKSAFEDPSDLFESQFGDLITLYQNDNLFNRTSRFPSFSGVASVQSVINTQVIQPVVLGEATAEEACSNANSAVQDVIDDELA